MKTMLPNVNPPSMVNENLLKKVETELEQFEISSSTLKKFELLTKKEKADVLIIAHHTLTFFHGLGLIPNEELNRATYFQQNLKGEKSAQQNQ